MTAAVELASARAPGPRYRNPLRLLRDLQEGGLDFPAKLFDRYGPVVEVRTYPRSMFWIKSPTALRQVLFTNGDNYTKGNLFDRLRVVGGNGMFFTDGEIWLRSKRIIGPYFRRHNMKNYVDALVAAGNKCNQDISDNYEGRECNIDLLMPLVALDVVGKAFFGMDIPAERITALAQAVTNVGELGMQQMYSLVAAPWMPTELKRRGRRSIKVVYDTIDDLITEGLARPKGDDLLSQLLDNVRSGELSRAQLREELWTIVNAGHETTATTMAVMLYHLGKDQSWQAEVAAQIDEGLQGGDPTFEMLGRLSKLDWTTHETLRLYPSASGTARQAQADDEVDGFFVPKGSIVQASFHWLQRDPQFWEDPDEFRPERFAVANKSTTNAYMPFGGGARRCLGEHFAYLEALIIVTKILQRFRVEARDDFFVEPYMAVATRMRNGVQVTLRDRSKIYQQST